jgi:hypothetical protein
MPPLVRYHEMEGYVTHVLFAVRGDSMAHQ